jgi:hypothetical protein
MNCDTSGRGGFSIDDSIDFRVSEGPFQFAEEFGETSEICPPEPKSLLFDFVARRVQPLF